MLSGQFDQDFQSILFLMFLYFCTANFSPVCTLPADALPDQLQDATYFQLSHYSAETSSGFPSSLTIQLLLIHMHPLLVCRSHLLLSCCSSEHLRVLEDFANTKKCKASCGNTCIQCPFIRINTLVHLHCVNCGKSEICLQTSANHLRKRPAVH